MPRLPEVSPQAPTEEAPPAELKLLTDYVESGGNYLALTDRLWQLDRRICPRCHRAEKQYLECRNQWSARIRRCRSIFWGGRHLQLQLRLVRLTHAGLQRWRAFSGLVSGRTDSLNRKWGGRRQLITTVGFGYYAAKDVHRDHSFFVGSTYYFKKPWILEEGVRFNISNPGSVFSPAGFIAVTQGRNQQHYVTIRAGLGKEAYQLVGPTSTITDFHSQTLTITWRRWVGPHWGVNVVADYYHNPTYMRGGTSVGFFKEF